MNKKEFISSGLIEKYLLGLTNEAEDNIVHEWMEKDAQIKDQIMNVQDNLLENAKVYDKKAPAHIKSAILGNINDQNKSEKHNNSNRNVLVAACVAGICMLLSTIYLWSNNQQLLQEKAQLEDQLNTITETLKSTETVKATLASNEYILTHTATSKVSLRGTNISPDASMYAYYNPVAEVLLIKINKLPPPPADHYYHMWADVDGKMKHIGKISHDAVELTSLEYISDPTSLNVTLENASEVDHPDVNNLRLVGQVVQS